jgi:hypothetical protein
MKAKDLINIYAPSILIYGAAGTGKTALVSQLKNAYLFDFDKGMNTAKTLNDGFTDKRQCIEFDTYWDMDVNNVCAYQRAKDKLLSFQSDAVSKRLKWKGIVIDSLTGLCRAIQMHVLAKSGNSLGIPKIQHYGEIVNEVEATLAIVRSFNIPVILTAHEMIVDIDDSTSKCIMSATKPHSSKIPWLFDEVLYAICRPKGQGKTDYIISGMPSSMITTRTRSGIDRDIAVNDIGLEGLLDIMGYKQSD